MNWLAFFTVVACGLMLSAIILAASLNPLGWVPFIASVLIFAVVIGKYND